MGFGESDEGGSEVEQIEKLVNRKKEMKETEQNNGGRMEDVMGPGDRGRVCVYVLYFLSRCKRPEGPWQRLAAALAGSSLFYTPVT